MRFLLLVHLAIQITSPQITIHHLNRSKKNLRRKIRDYSHFSHTNLLRAIASVHRVRNCLRPSFAFDKR